MKRYVDLDQVLNLFGIDDNGFYARRTIEDAVYTGELPVIEIITDTNSNET